MQSLNLMIETGARLHFGPLSYRPEVGRHFGGIGLMIREPGVSLRFSADAERDDSDRSGESIVVFDECSRASAIAKTIREARPDWDRPIDIDVASEIPSHQGLGSGTQLSMAVAEGLASLHGVNDLSLCELASLGRRGSRSTIGLHGYQTGGFLVDAGHAPGAALGELACRIEFPENWPVVLVTPPQSSGLSGEGEAEAFAELSPMSQEMTGELCRLVLTGILPGIQSQVFSEFCHALQRYGDLAGEFFREVQGGRYSHSEMEGLAKRIAQLADPVCVVQSSWGPTVAVFVENDLSAQQLVDSLNVDLASRDWKITRTSALNTGRRLSFE
ncbi:beta-ribofuranosylaminobenzene 5'-phosphate synthase family protein [Thalassoglobus sp. JC818]|uniref:beta-ribofuranosylaminobenzene 5'-phosphate synthase family protein n=1 Tax=Thalassoglobus sp. JC818 TaxID=3232136 RepID=UPI0034587931